MKQGLLILATIAVCLFLPLAMSADTIKGRIVDAETGDPLESAEIVFTEVAISDNSTIVSTVRADSLGRFVHTLGTELSKLTITASYFGYHSQTVKRMGNNDRDTITIDDIRLKMNEHLLSKVTVKGRARRFYMRGDTVVYNPQAFRTQDGASLIELIEQLPDVTIKDGKLLWNGKPLKLMMNGHVAMNEGMMPNLVPVEAVKDIKAYDKQSEISSRTGVADGKEEHVLDVTIKPGFMDKIYGDVEAGGYSNKHYAAHLRAMRLSDTDPLMLYGRLADDPKVIDVTTINTTSSHQGSNPVRQQTGAIGYGHLWKPDYKVRVPNFWSINGATNHTDYRSDSWENRQTFRPGSTATETDRTCRDYQHNLKLPVDFESFFNLSPNMMLSVNANVTYNRERGNAKNSQQTFNLESPGIMTNTSDFYSLTTKEGFSTKMGGRLLSFFGKTEFGAALNISYDNSKNDGQSTGVYRYFQSGTTQTDRQFFHAPAHDLKADVQLKARRPLGKDIMLSASWQTTYQNNYRDEQRHRADTFDIANSLLRKDKTWRNILRTDANITQGKLSMNPSLELTHNYEQSDYRRGRLDTIAKRNELLVRPSMDMTYKFGKQTRLMGHIAYDSQQPDIIDCIGYYDDTNPLYIITGNPHLKTSHTLNASLRFATMSTKANQVFNVSFDYSKTYDPIGMVMHYTTSTGGYLVQKRNMRGGERWGFELNYERDFGKLRLKNKLSESFGQAYGIMTLVDDATGLSYNRQRSSYFEELLRLEYADGPFSLKLNQDFGWHRYTYSDAAQSRQNIYNYRAEFNGQYNWKSWTIQLLPTFHLNRGYMADQMNVNRFLFNASISYKFLKNKARLSLYANDLFNRDTRYHSDVTVTTRTESGSSFLHHYVCLTFNYKFDAKKR